jgi:signal transduction histidine kinase
MLKGHELDFKTFNIHAKVNNNTTKPFKGSEKLTKLILQNLLTNAIKFRDHNKASTQKTINVVDNAFGVRIVFSDNGIGIPKAAHKDVFRLFFSAQNNFNTGGFGMFIIKHAVRKMSGHISFVGDPGFGTVFKIDLANLT